MAATCSVSYSLTYQTYGNYRS